MKKQYKPDYKPVLSVQSDKYPQDVKPVVSETKPVVAEVKAETKVVKAEVKEVKVDSKVTATPKT